MRTLSVIVMLCLGLLGVSSHAQQVQAPVAASPITQAAAFNDQGLAAFNAKNYADAIPLFQKAVALAPGEVNYMTNLASAHRQLNQYTEALALLTDALKPFPGVADQNALEIAIADTHFFWARALGKQDKQSDAVSHYQAAAAIDRTRRPSDAGFDLDSLGDALHSLQRDTEALAAYRESLTFRRSLTGAYKNIDNEASSLKGIIIASLALGQYDAAASALDDLRTVKPDAATLYEPRVLDAFADAHGPGGANTRKITQAAALNTVGVADYIAKHYAKAIPEFQQAMALVPSKQAYVLNLARALNLAKRNGEALTLIEAKLGFFPDPDERKELLIEWADAHFSFGIAADVQKRWSDARSHFMAAYSIDRVARRRDAAIDLRHAGEDFWQQRRFAAAQKLYQQSVAIAQETGNVNGEAVALGDLGLALSEQQQYPAAIEILQKALAISRSQKLRFEEARDLQNLADCANALSRYPEALDWQRQSLAAFREVDNQSAIGTMLSNLGITADNLSRFAEAMSYYAQALAVERAAHDTTHEASVLGNMGLTLYHQGRYAESIKALRQALALRGPDGKLMDLPQVSGNLALTLGEIGRFHEAIKINLSALASYRRKADRAGEVACLNNLAVEYESLGEYDKTITLYRQALAIRRTLGDRAGEALEMNNAGLLYASLGQVGKAVGLYRAAIAIQHEIGDRNGEAITINNQAGVFTDAGAADASYYAQGQAGYEQALAIYRDVGNAGGEATTLNNLGYLNSLRHRPDEARAFFEQALAAHRRSGDRDGESGTLNNLASNAEGQHHFDQAERYYEQALAIATETGNKDSLQVTWSNVMDLAAKAGNPSWAIYCGKQSVNILQSLRGKLKNFKKGEQKDYLELHVGTYRFLAELLIKQGRLDEAQQVLEMLKEEEFFDFLGRDPTAARTLIASAALSPNEADWQARFQKAADRTAILAVAAHAFQTAAPPQAASPLRQLLPPGTAAVYTIVEPDKLLLVVTTSTGQVAREFSIKSDDLYRKVLAFRNALQDPAHDPRPLAQDLYRIIIGPIANDVANAHATTLLWSLDDALRYLPIAALHDGKHYLVERYNNCVLTLAGPARTVPTQTTAPWTGLGLGVSHEHPGFDALPGVRAELAGIIGPVVPGTALLDSQFTQVTFLAGLKRKSYPLVHIASHFALSGRDTDSFLLLGDGAHLTMAQMKSDPHVFKGVDLLTLSACNTAMEVRSAGGKEVEGFGALAQRLGAKSVLASLWPVADASTPVLMREFYRLRRKSPRLSKATDLRQAQTELLTGQVTASALPGTTNRAKRAKVAGAVDTTLPLFVPNPRAPYAHPYYWAPFVLIGSP